MQPTALGHTIATMALLVLSSGAAPLVEAAFASFERRPGWFDDVSQGGIVAAGLSSLARWLKQQE